MPGTDTVTFSCILDPADSTPLPGMPHRQDEEDPKDQLQDLKQKRVTVEEVMNSRSSVTDWRQVKLSKRLTFREALEVGKKELHRDPWVLTPQGHPILQWWDCGTMICLGFVALVTPAEVALLDTQLDALFFINRFIDLVFIVDMALQFCVAYRVKTPYGSRLETRRNIIVRHYLRTWFFVDVLSILPFDVIGMIAQSAAVERIKAMKVLKLLRLLKLVRVLRASRLFHRWETSMAINYNTLKLVFAFLVFIIASHWIACVWAMLGFQDEQDGEGTWLAHASPTEGDIPSGPLEVYITALYWSSMTVTSVGYGDIVPVNTTERLVCALLMFASGFLWAYALGETMSALGNSNMHEKDFRQMLDDLNHMMADRGLPRNLERRLRSFFFQIKDLARVQGYKVLVEQLSPSLQGELAMTVNEVWLRKVWYFNSDRLRMPSSFLQSLATMLQVSVHAQQECVGDPWTLYILHRGLCVRRMRILNSGSVWGEDFILASHRLLDTSQAFCFTFVELSRLTRRRLIEIVKHSPEVWAPLRAAVVRTAARRGVVLEAARQWKSRSKARSSFMSFAAAVPNCISSAGTEGDFPLSTMTEEPSEVGETLHNMAAKQACMQQQLDATRTSMSESLSRIESQLKLLLPHRPDGIGKT